MGDEKTIGFLKSRKLAPRDDKLRDECELFFFYCVTRDFSQIIQVTAAQSKVPRQITCCRSDIVYY